MSYHVSTTNKITERVSKIDCSGNRNTYSKALKNGFNQVIIVVIF